MELTKVLIAPVITEKSSKAQESRKYSFLVHLKTNKVEVAKAVENAYGVKIQSVDIVPVRKKTRLVGRGKEITKRQAAKKAIVTLAPKQSIDFNKIKSTK